MKENQTSNNQEGSGFFSGLLFGAILGAVAGILIAPDKGSETRKRLQIAKNKVSKTVAPVVEELTTTISPLVNDAVEQSKPAVKKIRRKFKNIKK